MRGGLAKFWPPCFLRRGPASFAVVRRPPRSVPALCSLLAALVLVGCGRPATEAECREILTRIVELEMEAQNLQNDADIEKRRQDLEASLGGETGDPYDGCVGKRITDRQLECVRAAKTAGEITRTCLR